MTTSKRLAAFRADHAPSHALEANELPVANSGDEEPTPDPDEEEPEMTDTTAMNEAVAQAVAAERTRTNAVLASEHYAGREALATNLLATDLSAEQITAALASATKVEPAAITTPAPDADEAARAEMRAAITDNANSGIEAGSGGGVTDQQTAEAGMKSAIAKANEMAGY